MLIRMPSSKLHADHSSVSAPEEIFASKYAWLLGWALHFTQNDRALAEDLVQETFVRFVLSQAQKPEIVDAANAEPLLYRYLKYAHLSQIRDAARAQFQSLDVIDYDSLTISLRAHRSADPIEAQHNLRRVAAYISWRKESAKSASILILRFIHGFFPEEIMRIGIVTRRAVDIGITKAREEAKRFLTNATTSRLMHTGAPPAIARREFALAPEKFIAELQETIFASKCSPCLPEETLLQRYSTRNAQPIPCELLAHIVSCRTCLERITRARGITPPASRSIDDFIGYDSRFRSGSSQVQSEQQRARNVLRLSKERLSEAFVHRPQRIVVVVDGRVLATQDVTSTVNRLEVELGSTDQLEFIEVISEQNVCLLAMSIPAMSQQVQRDVRLSDGRTVEAVVRSRSVGPAIVVTYCDPLMAATRGESAVESIQSAVASKTTPDADEIIPAKASPAFVRYASALWRAIIQILKPGTSWKIGILSAVVALVCIALFFHPGRPHPQSAVTPQIFFERATAADAAQLHLQQPAVIAQKIRIRSGNLTLERTLHRDSQDKRHASAEKLGRKEAVLRDKLANAGVQWEHPLSAADFAAWHNRQPSAHDVISNKQDGLLVLTTNLMSGAVASESLTVRASDFHEVARRVQFRDAEPVEIAELSYDIVPWFLADPDWFEPVVNGLGSNSIRPHRDTISRLSLPTFLTDEQLDDAELNARLVLTNVNAYTSERIQITRRREGIEVRGIVATEDRKRQLNSLLGVIPHVKAAIVSFVDMQKREEQPQQVNSIQQSSDTAEPSPLTKLLMKRGIGDQEANKLNQDLLNCAQRVNLHSRAIEELQNRFRNQNALSSSSRDALMGILANQEEKLHGAVQLEKQLLLQAGLQVTENNQVENELPGLAAPGEQNLNLCIRLTIGKPDDQPDIDTLVSQISASLRQVQDAVDRVHINAPKPASQPDVTQATTTSTPK